MYRENRWRRPTVFLIPDTCPDCSCLIFHSRFVHVDIPACLKDSRRSERKEKEDPARCLLRIAAAEFRHLLGDASAAAAGRLRH